MTTLERFPVSVYRSTDTGAPKNDGTANCVSTILKACLVTGYGTKAAAGWQMAFEDVANGIKVIKPPKTAEPEFFLRLSADTGKQVVTQVYSSMTDINTGDLRLQCGTQFKYAANVHSDKWLLLATKMGFWFFSTEKDTQGFAENKSGYFLYCGFTAKNTLGNRGVYLTHTGGNWDAGYYARLGIFAYAQSGSMTAGKLYNPVNYAVSTAKSMSLFTGSANLSAIELASPLYLSTQSELWRLPAVAPSRNDKANYATHTDALGRQWIKHATSSYETTNDIYIPTDFWEL